MATTARNNDDSANVNVLGMFDAVTGPVPSSLELEILALGVDVISADRVKRYQECQVRASRIKAGWWGKHVELASDLADTNAIVFLLSIVGLIFGWFFVGIQTIWFLVPVVASAAAVNFFTTGTKMGDAMARWTSKDPFQYDEEVPARIKHLIKTLSAIPGTTVTIEYFKDDPFIFLERDAGERCCFGYWDAPGFEQFE